MWAMKGKYELRRCEVCGGKAHRQPGYNEVQIACKVCNNRTDGHFMEVRAVRDWNNGKTSHRMQYARGLKDAMDLQPDVTNASAETRTAIFDWWCAIKKKLEKENEL